MTNGLMPKFKVATYQDKWFVEWIESKKYAPVQNYKQACMAVERLNSEDLSTVTVYRQFDWASRPVVKLWQH